MIRYHRLIAVGILFALAISTLGCADSLSTRKDQQGNKIGALLTLYIYAGKNLGHTPKNEREFKRYVQEQGGLTLEHLNLQSVDDLFTSSRDGKPYVVVYGEGPSGVVVYEAEGVNGLREVGFQTGQTKQLNNEEFTALGL